jgi:excisionase family DNA binding protein
MVNNKKDKDVISIYGEVNRQIFESFVRKCIGEEIQKQCNSETYPHIMTVNQVANYLGLARVTIYKKVQETSIPFFKLGKKVLFKKDEIDLWLGKHRVQTTDEFINGLESKH